MLKVLLRVVIAAFILSMESAISLHAGPESLINIRGLVIWAHSDIQPRSIKEREHYRAAVTDVRSNLGPVDIAIIAGDIVQNFESDDDFKWIVETRKTAGIINWYEIAGNHDARNLANYFKYIKKPLYYSVVTGNLLIIFLSDEMNSSATEISDNAFQWWEEWVVKNQDKTIITITHAQLPESGLMFSSIYRSKVLSSERFVKVMKKNRVDLWLSGHTTSPGISGFNENIVKELNNTLFINISSIRREMGMNSRSRMLYFSGNNRELVIKLRDHDKKKFIEGNEKKIMLRAPFAAGDGIPRIFYPQGTIIPE